MTRLGTGGIASPARAWVRLVVLLAGPLGGCATAPPRVLACIAKPVAVLPITFHDDVPTTTVLLDGAPVSLVLDLGAQASVLSEGVVDRLRMPRDPTALPTISGVGGSNTRWAATVGRLTLDRLVLDDKRMEVAPIAFTDGQRTIEGALGLDVLESYDVDWNLPNRRVTLNTPSDCAAPPPGWSVPATEVALRHPSGAAGDGRIPGLLQLTMRVDGHPVTAMLDTGAGISLIAPDAAAALEGSGAGAGVAVMLAGVGADTPSGHLHRFGSITVAGDTVPQWPMVIAPVPEWAGNMILGAGFMRLHRAWLPAGGSSIWFGPRVTDLGGKAATDR